MQLTGTITLDDETMDNLREEIREEVIEEIRKDGVQCSEEILKFLTSCKYQTYVSLIHKTIDFVIERAEDENAGNSFERNVKSYHRLLAIKALFDI